MTCPQGLDSPPGSIFDLSDQLTHFLTHSSTSLNSSLVALNSKYSVCFFLQFSHGSNSLSLRSASSRWISFSTRRTLGTLLAGPVDPSSPNDGDGEWG